MAGDRLGPSRFGSDLGAEGFCHWSLVGITDTYCAEGTSSCRYVGSYGKGGRNGAPWLVACRVFVRTMFGLDGAILLRYTYYDANPKDDAVWSSPSPATTGTTPADRLRNHCLSLHRGHISVQRKQNTECIDRAAECPIFGTFRIWDAVIVWGGRKVWPRIETRTSCSYSQSGFRQHVLRRRNTTN